MSGELHGPHVLVLHEKHGAAYFLVSNLAELEEVAQFVVRERLAEGWFSDFVGKPAGSCPKCDPAWPAETSLSDARAAVDNPKLALAFLRRRSREGHEYERIDVEPVVLPTKRG